MPKRKTPKPAHSFPTTMYARESHCEDCGADMQVSELELDITDPMVNGDLIAVYVLKEIRMCHATMQRKFEVVAHA